MKLTMKDGQEIQIYKWNNVEESELKGIIQLVHGSCEHAMRYDEFANYLNTQGYLVYANDHRGHGNSVQSAEDFGYFGENGGWELMVSDLYELNQEIVRENPNLPIIMLGHSMGSFLARHYAIDFGETLSGLILSGTAHNPRTLLRFGRSISHIIKQVKGPKYRSKFINKLSYDSFNKPYKQPRTTHEWLSRDSHVVDEFLKDKRCGFIFTTSGFKDMFSGLLYITKQKNIEKIPKNLPTLFISGEEDPVGGNGKMVIAAYESFKAANMQDVEIKLYPKMRHEILNELEKEQVYKDIISFIHKRAR